MKNVLKYTYLLDLKKLQKSVDDLWNGYQKILNNKNSTWDDVNEARAILYFLGYLWPEGVALDSLQRRISFIKPKISLNKFFLAIDGKDSAVLDKYKNNKKFNQLENFYLILKNIKNKAKNNTYLDEGRFNKIYSKLKPKNYY